MHRNNSLLSFSHGATWDLKNSRNISIEDIHPKLHFKTGYTAHCFCFNENSKILEKNANEIIFRKIQDNQKYTGNIGSLRWILILRIFNVNYNSMTTNKIKRFVNFVWIF